jgi:ribosomal protein S12 methylthiotransferase accessory factor
VVLGLRRSTRAAPRIEEGDTARRLAEARILIVGLSPWGAVMAGELAAAGAGALHLLDDATVTPADLLSVRAWSSRHLGRPRREALAETVAEASPRCSITLGPMVSVDDVDRAVRGGGFSLIVGATPGDELQILHGLARAAHASGVPSLCGYLEGLTAVVGPAVLPGKTACWSCARLRQLASSGQIEADHALHAALLAQRARPRAPTYLAPMAPALGHLLAMEALRLVSGDGASPLLGRLLVLDLVGLGTTLHAVLRMPWCDVCGGAAQGGPCARAPSPERLDTARDPAELRGRLSGWIDPRTGLIRRLVVRTPDALDPDLPVKGAAHLTHFTDGTYSRIPPGDGYGKGLSVVDAMIGAVGEAIEHYAAQRCRRADLRRASLAAIDEDRVDPRDLDLYGELQYAQPGFPFARFDPDQPIEWARGQWLDRREPVLVPALPVFLYHRVPREERFCQVTSSGLAAGADLEDASLRALLELIERDALMITWLSRRPGQRLLIDQAIDEGAREVVRQLEERGARIELYHLDAGLGVPTVACLGFGNGERWPGATLALAAHPSPLVAARKAILEQGQVGPHLRRLMTGGKHSIPARPEDVHDGHDHALYYAPADRAGILDFLRVGDPISAAELPSPPEVSLGACVERLSEAGVRVAIAEVTPPDLRGGPLRVVRALATDVQQIHFGFRLRRLGNPRLHRFVSAARGGAAPGAALAAPLNPHPHPLA